MSDSAGGSQLSDYLERLPATSLRRLYQQPSSVFAVNRRILDPLSQEIVQCILYIPEPIPLAHIDMRIAPGAKMARDKAISALRSLHIIQISPPGKDRQQEVQLTTNFKNSMRLALEGGGDHNSFGVPSTLPVDPTITIPHLDHYCRRKWEDILHYVVSSVNAGGTRYAGGSGGPSHRVKELLQTGRLVQVSGGDPKTARVTITQAGFTFLLQEASHQVWNLLLLLLHTAEAAGDSGTMDPISMLSFLFMLGCLELGRAYDPGALPAMSRDMLPVLVDLGLIYIPKDTQQFFPTRLATTLLSDSSPIRSISRGFDAAVAGTSNDASSIGAAAAATERKGIFVETNYKLYAYTSDPLQIAVLSLFTKLLSRFPNMITGELTRESIRRAISCGITADQVIHYLAAHAHEEMHKTAAKNGMSGPLPPTVMDQIRLWQLETERMSQTNGYLFKELDTREQYLALVGYAQEIAILKWKDDRQMLFVVTKVEPMREFLKNRKKGE